MFFQIFDNVSEKEKAVAIESLIQHSSPRKDFFLMVILSVAMATFGVILDSAIILIGSMLIAPVLFPIMSLAMGIVMDDKTLVSKSFYTLLKSVFYALAAAVVISVIFLELSSPSQPAIVKAISDVNQSLIMYTIVAIIAGIAASFAIIKPNLNETLPGVAVTVSLVPPLAIVSYGVSKLDWSLIVNFSMLFLLNIAGIIFSALLVFALFGFQKEQKVAAKSIQKEERVLEKEND